MKLSGVSSSFIFCNFSSKGAVIFDIGISLGNSARSLSILNAILNGGCYIYSDFRGRDKRREQINKLEEKYAPLDVDNLTRRLEIRKDTYNRLK